MISADGLFVLVLNGESYNFREFRNRLDYSFRSKCDSAVLLAAWLNRGLACRKERVGMHAFAECDCHELRRHLVRDRVVMKPLHYFQGGDYVPFSAEIRSPLARDRVFRRCLRRWNCGGSPMPRSEPSPRADRL